MLRIGYGAIFIFAINAAPGYSQDVSEDETIIVTGTGLQPTPGAVAYGSVDIDRERIEDDAAHRIETVLAISAGVQQFRRSDSRSANPSAQGVTVRALGGNASSRTLVLLDGVPVTDPFFGYVPFNLLRPEAIGAARVTRGGGAGGFGAGALAGTVELTSLVPTVGDGLLAGAAYGSHNAAELYGLAPFALGAGMVVANGHFERGDGFYVTPNSNRVAANAPSRYRDWSLGARAIIPAGDGEVQARMSLFRDRRTLRFRGADNGIEGEDASIRYVGRGLGGSGWQMEALAYLQRRDFSNRVISATRYTLTLDQHATPSIGLGGKVELRPPLPQGQVLRLGLDSRLARGRADELAYNAVGAVTARRSAGGRNLITGAYAEYDHELGTLVLTGGVRLDHWRISDGFLRERSGAGTLISDMHYATRSSWRPSGRGGVYWRADDSISLRMAGYTGFRLPTLNELYRPFTVFPVTTRANAGLEPETLTGVEGGVDLRPAKGWMIGVTAFHNRLRHAIANVTIGTNVRERQGVSAIVAKGLEFSVLGEVGQWRLNGFYALSDSRVDAPGTTLDGLVPAQSPRHNAGATIAGPLFWGSRIAVTGRYLSSQFEDDLNLNRIPDAFTMDAMLSIAVMPKLSVKLRGENLFNTRVITRQVGNDIDLGTPRTLWISMRFGRD